ncbi:MAG: hypothetical protein ABGW74_06545 [Campylobacterales bacterium]
MFDFMDEDWFTITIEVFFLIFIIYDAKQYLQSKKKEYLVNIVLTIGFALWTLYPMYISYFKWSETQKEEVLKSCEKEDNVTLCRCVDGGLFKEYGFEELKSLDKDKLQKIKEETKEDCLDDGWF